jgi:hypothetical protein
MAITVNTFNSLSFLPFTDVAWTGLVPGAPALPSIFLDAVLAGTNVFGFVLNAGDPFTFLSEFGTANIPAAVVDAEATQTSVIITDSNGTRSDLARSLDGSLLYWRTGTKLVTYDSTAIADINSITT